MEKILVTTISLSVIERLKIRVSLASENAEMKMIYLRVTELNENGLKESSRDIINAATRLRTCSGKGTFVLKHNSGHYIKSVAKRHGKSRQARTFFLSTFFGYEMELAVVLLICMYALVVFSMNKKHEYSEVISFNDC